jgi:hypothetical protein
MDYIYQVDFTDFPTSLEQVSVAKSDRDDYAKLSLGLSDGFVYTKQVFDLFDPYTYTAWENLDKVYCLKAAEWHCRTSMTNKHNTHTLMVANGNVLFCKERLPTPTEVDSIYSIFSQWNGSNAASHIGGYPFRIYIMRYMPDESVEEDYYADESQQVDEKPTLAWDEDNIPPPPQNSPVLRRSERLAKKKVRRSQRLSELPRVDYAGME